MTKDIYADVDVHSNKILDLADGEAPTDGVNFGQLSAVSDAIQHVTVATTAPQNPRLFDLWVDLSA